MGVADSNKGSRYPYLKRATPMEQPLHDDLMIGVKPIAKFTGQPTRRVFHMLASGQLPGFKLGNKWAARKSTLQQHIVEREHAAAKPERKSRKP
jgi:hypothetical protein